MKIPDMMTNLRVSYNLIMGSFDSDGFGTVEYSVLTLGLIINPIIMMTILISIIGDEYERVQADSLSSDIRELIDLEIEVENLMF